MPQKSKSKSVASSSTPKRTSKSSKSTAPRPIIRGRGDYEIGQKLGSKIGGWVGEQAQKAIMAITGMGDYKVKMNSIVNPNGPPVFAQNGRHDVVVCHREFVSLVSSPGSAFNVNSYAINPIANAFVWLPALAANFELFRFMGLVFEFKATSATAVASTNTALGSVILATRYNAQTAPFTSQMQMEAYEYSTSTVAFTSCIHPVECAPNENALEELYTDPGFASGDPRFSFLGVFDIATVGQQAASVLGELWVSYHVQLIRPRLLGQVTTVGYTSRYGALQVATTPGAGQLFQAIVVEQSLNGTGLNSSSPSTLSAGGLLGTPSSQSLDLLFTNNSFSFPQGVSGYFAVIINIQGEAAVTLSPPAFTFTNGAYAAYFLGFGGQGYLNLYPGSGVASTSVCMQMGVYVTPTNGPAGGLPTVTSGAFALPVNEPYNISVQVFQLNS